MILRSASDSQPIINFNDVHFAYPDPRGDGQGEWVLQGVSFEVRRGQVMAVIGPTGSGQSTLALAMLGIVPQSTGGWIRGRIQVCGLDPRHTPVAQMAQSVGLVVQDPDSQFITNSVAEEVAFGLESLGVPSEAIPPLIERSLELVGMTGLQDRSPYQLSGGQKQRVAIASILAMEPEVLILDEASASLDPVGAAELRQALRDLRAERATTIILISNELDWIQDFADQVLVLAQGRIKHQGPPGDIFARVPELMEAGLAPPQLQALKHQLYERTGHLFEFSDWDTAEQELVQLLTRESS